MPLFKSMPLDEKMLKKNLEIIKRKFQNTCKEYNLIENKKLKNTIELLLQYYYYNLKIKITSFFLLPHL